MSEAWTMGASALGGIAGGVLQANAASKAANKIAGGNQTALQAYQLGTSQYGQLMDPYVQAGFQGLPALSAHLGFDPAPINNAIHQTSAAQGVNADPSRILQMFPDVMAEYQRLSPNNLKNNLGVSSPEQFASWWWNQHGQFEPWRIDALQGQPAGSQQGASNPMAATPYGDDSIQHETTPGSAMAPGGGQGGANLYGGGYAAPVFTPPPAYSAPSYAAADPFSYTLANYQASPSYQWQQDEARAQTLAGAAATGSLQSGAAAKTLQDRAQQVANLDFDNERSFAYGQYVNDRDFGRNTYESDRGFDYGKYLNDLNFGRSTYQDDRDFGYRQFGDQRAYDANRYDQQTKNLFDYTTLGQGAAGQVGNALLGYGNQAAGIAQSNGQAYGNAALAKGNAMAGIAQGVGGAASSYLSSLGQPQSQSPQPSAPQASAQWSPAQLWAAGLRPV